MDYQPIGHVETPSGPLPANAAADYLATWQRMTPEEQAWVGVEVAAVRAKASHGIAWDVAAVAVAAFALATVGLYAFNSLRAKGKHNPPPAPSPH